MQIGRQFAWNVKPYFLEGKQRSLVNIVKCYLLKFLLHLTGTGLTRKNVQLQLTLVTKSWTRLSRITAYLEVKILSLLKHENLTTGKKKLWKRGEIAPKEHFLLFSGHNIFNISLTSRVQLNINLLNLVVRIVFSSILQIWYVEVRIARSISESPVEFEITRIDCIFILNIWT